MTRNRNDQFAKDVLDELLFPFGRVKREETIPGEELHADLSYHRHEHWPQDLEPFGILPRMLSFEHAFFEPFSTGLVDANFISCMSKLCWAQLEGARKLEVARKAKRGHIREERSPHEGTDRMMWILTPTCPEARLVTFGLTPAKPGDWPQGFYFLAPGWRFGVVIVHQLLETPETLPLRIFGSGKVRERALVEMTALRDRNPALHRVAEIFARWYKKFETHRPLTAEEKELAMSLHSAVQEFEDKGRERLVRAILAARFGQIDDALEPVVTALIELKDQETAIAVNLSREELLERFGRPQ